MRGDANFAHVGLELVDCEVVNAVSSSVLDSFASNQVTIGSNYSRYISIAVFGWLIIIGYLIYAKIIPGRDAISKFHQRDRILSVSLNRQGTLESTFTGETAIRPLFS